MFEQLLADLGRELRAAGIEYMIIGGQAVLVYGEPRLTRDVDVTLALTPVRLPEVLEVVERLHLRPLVDPDSFVAETLVLPCEHRESNLRVDFIFSFSEYESTAIERSRSVKFRDFDVSVASPEDLIIHKIIAGRPRDLEDVHGVLVRQQKLDLRYIRRWLDAFSEELGQPLRDAFDAAVSKAGE